MAFPAARVLMNGLQDPLFRKSTRSQQLWLIKLPARLFCSQFGIGRITPLIWSHSVTWKGASFKRPNGWTPRVVDVFSVSACINSNFAEYIADWKHNGYRLFDSPELIREVAAAHQ